MPIFQQNLNSSSMMLTCKEELPGKQLIILFWIKFFVSIVFSIIFPFLLSFPSDIYHKFLLTWFPQLSSLLAPHGLQIHLHREILMTAFVFHISSPHVLLSSKQDELLRLNYLIGNGCCKEKFLLISFSVETEQFSIVHL